MNDVANAVEQAEEQRDRIFCEVTRRGRIGAAIGLSALLWECGLACWSAVQFYRGVYSLVAPTFVEIIGDHAARMLG